MLHLAEKHPILFEDEIKARSERLLKDFPSLLKRPGIQQRLTRAVAMASFASSNGTIIEVFPGVFQIHSESNKAGRYTVDTTKNSCTCPDAGSGRVCKHRLAVALYAGWFENEQPAAKPVDLQPGFYGYITNPSHTRERLRVRIVAIDAPNNLVTMQTEPVNSSSFRPAPFTAWGTENQSSCVGTYTPDEWKKRFDFAPDREANEIEAA